MSGEFILGPDAYKAGRKSLKSLVSHSRDQNGPDAHEPVFVIINTKIQLAKAKDYTPRIIPITHKLSKLETKSVLLVTKDPSTPYRDALQKKESPTEDVFNQIYTLAKLKSLSRDPKKLYKLFKEFDIVVSDHRVHKFLPNILGSTFYVKNKKVPFMIQMAKPDPDAKLTVGKKSTKLKDDRCEPKYVRAQMKAIVGNTYFIPPVNGNCLSIKVGYTSFSDKELIQNIDDVLQYLVQEKFQPVGGLLRSTSNIGGVYVKTGDSISLPVLVAEKKEEEEEADSDFDFYHIMEGASQNPVGSSNAAEGADNTASHQIGQSFNHLAAPVGDFIHSFLHDLEEDEIEQVEHFEYKQDLERKLTVTSVIGLGVTLMGVPFGISSTLWISLVDGANVTILYGWLVVAFFSFCVVLSLSEIISKYPTAGGVYHFSAILSNDKYSLISSWFTGWFLLIGNWTYAVSIMFSGSQFILSVFGLKNAYHKQDVLEVLGIYFILLTICGFINFKFSKYLERINKICILWSIYTVLAIDFLLIFFAKKTNSIKDILTTFDNTRSGWPDALAFMVGLQSSSFTLTGYGMLFSMTDEVKNPERNMPKGAISAILLSTVMGIIFILPLLTILPELTLLLDSNTEIMPIDLVFKLSTESYILSFLLVLLLIGTVFFQSIGSLTTASRTTYAFARDGGLPFKEYWVAVDSIDDSTVPKNALFLSMLFCGVLALMSLVSASAFNSFMGASVVCLALANGIPILCLMLDKRRKIKGAPFRLRKLGWVINSLSLGWVLFLFVILCLPPVIKNLTWFSMNYALLVICAFAGFAGLGYKSWGIGSFHGPQIDTDYFELNNIAGRQTINDAFVIGVDDMDVDEESDHSTKDPIVPPSEGQSLRLRTVSFSETELSTASVSESENEVLFEAGHDSGQEVEHEKVPGSRISSESAQGSTVDHREPVNLKGYQRLGSE
ncbi:uncharacterized protein CANTADRAFT_10679 [Suhomyces tanzawaensis NRRL Y-17324]|uniref:Uncharacterized protein n=1 Tax=Suhomyces tanzawaensis NRRL Y-17324 TaxID=984487 RepID=A0A1E4SJZ7_9ASCO|nr:uncharacterized protein CANTADRAFT_10679 [Suhomyces tanzawaensis NRRL Y-17324]ODV79829.1 hypothetical protein CANTADRAFT_10679 [Suhomyces tanzawaensis NRRL Y-17324]